jgi:hypothetical protein
MDTVFPVVVTALFAMGTVVAWRTRRHLTTGICIVGMLLGLVSVWWSMDEVRSDDVDNLQPTSDIVPTLPPDDY